MDIDTIFFVLISTATCVLINPFLILLLFFHLSSIHSPLLVTFMPVLSTAITMSSLSGFTFGSRFIFILATLHQIVVKSGTTPLSFFIWIDIILRKPSSCRYGSRYACTVASSDIKEFGYR